MILGRPKRKKVRLVKNPSSNLVQAKILEPRNHALPTKALPFRPGPAQLQQSISHNHAQAVSGRDERSYAPKAQSYQRTAVRPNEESIGWNSSAGGPQSPDPPVCIGKPRKQSLDQRKEAPQDSFSRDPALCELISSRFNAIITSIDGENFSGDERELDIHEDPQLRGGWGSATREVSKGANRAISSAVLSTNYFAKANLYVNSRLPPHLPSLKLHLPSYPLVCLAAQYSQRAYMKPTGKEREAHVDANWRMGTKAMVIKSVPIDDMNTVIFAIRGSQTFMDWAVNLNSAPQSPSEFLDDPGNLCHSGFLSVARKMIKPVAARLRSLLEEDPSRSGCSLLMTGHSAGGAIASLLYAHLMAEEVKSELSILTGCFKHIHCITFGTPPLSLLPLTKPTTPRHRKSLFLSFINEGDPVPRADKQYVLSLLDLYASPAPVGRPLHLPPVNRKPKLTIFKPGKRPVQPRPAFSSAPPPPRAWIWKVPPGTLSNAGSLVVLRSGNSRLLPNNNNNDDDDNVQAAITTDEQLRDVVFGDPMMHVMKLYCRRVEVLATKAVTARVWG